MTNHIPTSQIYIPPGMIDLGAGDPDFALLPLDLLQRAAQTCFAKGDPTFLQYGAEQGGGYFRLELAKFLSRGYGFPVVFDDLFVTNGISNALDLICAHFTRPGDTIFVEEPSYFLALRIFEDHDLRIIPIQTDRGGLVVEALKEKLSEFHPKFLYTVPTFQNPGGYTLSDERRERLVELSQEHNFIIVADEVYHFLNYSDQQINPFAAYTDLETVISLGSFSKILAPGLRLGWMQAHPKKINPLVTSGLLDSGGGLNPFTSAIVRELLEAGDLEKNINRLIAAYRSRLSAMDAALRRKLPQAEFEIPQGGFFFWVRLPGVDGGQLREKAREFQVGFRQGALFSSQGGRQDYIRLCYTFYDEEKIAEGIQRLRQCLESFS
ncbi:MAG: PLP-dependent aminotransferase family protein [Anaerolineales bacterium]